MVTGADGRLLFGHEPRSADVWVCAAYSGLSVLDFVKGMTVQELSPAGLRALGPTAVTLADLEGLDAHANAVTLRLKVLASEAETAAGGAVARTGAQV